MTKDWGTWRSGTRPPRKPSKLVLLALRAGSANMFYTYIIQSLKDQKLYVGFTGDLKRRFLEHNQGKINSTRNRKPFRLVYYEACLVEKLAIKREKYFKTGFGRRFLKDRLGLNELPNI